MDDPKAWLDEEDEAGDARQDDTDDPTVEVSLEALEEAAQARAREAEFDEDGRADTQDTDGSAYYPLKAQQQGLVYTPPDDPPVIPGDDLQGAEIAAGFGKTVEGDDSRAAILPDRVAGNDLDLEEQISDLLHKKSTTVDSSRVTVTVEAGVVYLAGVVQTLDDADTLIALVADVEGVVDVEDNLEINML
jgi:osmotically-inducible protein OsmY